MSYFFAKAAAGGGGGGTPAVTNSASAGDADVASTSGITTVSGRTLLAFVATDSSTTSVTITDSYGNTWTQLTVGTTGWLFKCENATGGAGHTFTATPNTTGLYPVLLIVEVSGAATSGATELLGEILDSSSPFDNSITTTSANRLLLNFVATVDTTGGADFVSYSASGWTKITEETDWGTIGAAGAFSANATSAGTTNASFTDSYSHALEAALVILAVHA